MKTFFLGFLVFLSGLALAGSGEKAPAASPKAKPVRVLMVGGGESHDFDRWYKQEDVRTLKQENFAKVTYTSDPSAILAGLSEADVLLLSNNQPIADEATRKAIFDFVQSGKGLVLCHAALWYNWKDWPEYNRKIVGGGSRGHDKYGEFAVSVSKPGHPVMKGVPGAFSLKDELYYFKPDSTGSPVEVLATAAREGAGTSFPSVFTVQFTKGRIVGIALGHDAASHELPAYRTLLRNAVKWAARKK